MPKCWNSLQNIDDIVIGRYWDGSVLCLVLGIKVVRPSLNAEGAVDDMRSILKRAVLLVRPILVKSHFLRPSIPGAPSCNVL